MAHSLSSDEEEIARIEAEELGEADFSVEEEEKEEEEDVDVDGFDEVKKETIEEGLLALEEIDPEEEEIWTVTVPSHINIDDLHDQPMVFASKSTCDLVAGNRKYETVVSKKRSILNMILPNYKGKAKTVSVAIRGRISLRESLETPSAPHILVLPDPKVRPAGEIKRRHPFFVYGDIPTTSVVSAAPATARSSKRSRKSDTPITPVGSATKRRRKNRCDND